jgi:hypothetical protein
MHVGTQSSGYLTLRNFAEVWNVERQNLEIRIVGIKM